MTQKKKKIIPEDIPLPGEPATTDPEDDGILRVDGNVTQAIYQKYRVKPNRKIKVKESWSYEYDTDPRVV